MGSDDEPLIGVGVSRFFDVCFTASPKRFTLVWASTALSALIVICIIKPAMSRTLRRPGCMQRVYYRRIMLLPVVFSLSSFVVTINPTMQMITYALQKMYEAWVLSTFGLLFFMFLATESVSLKHGTLPTQRSQGRNLESILATLNVEGPKKHFAAPPCGCFAFLLMQLSHPMYMFPPSRYPSRLMRWICGTWGSSSSCYGSTSLSRHPWPASI